MRKIVAEKPEFESLEPRVFLSGSSLASMVSDAVGTVAPQGMIQISNYTTDGSVGKTTWNAKNIADATEGYGPFDITFMTPIQTNALLINSNVDGHVLSTESRPQNTYGFTFDLGVQGTVVDLNNSLRYRVTNTTDLINPAIIYGGVTTPLIMDGSIHTIALPNVSGTNITYGTGYLQLREPEAPQNPVAEPSTLLLAAAGAAGLYATRKRRTLDSVCSACKKE